MRKQKFRIMVLVVGALVLVAPVVAQDEGTRTVTSPYQDEFDLKVGEVLVLNVSIDGLLWRNLFFDGGDPFDHRSGKKVKTVITSEVENLTEETLRLDVVLLLEDERGRKLDRVTMKTIKVGGGRFEQDDQKFKIDGRVLGQTAKVYLLAEVE